MFLSFWDFTWSHIALRLSWCFVGDVGEESLTALWSLILDIWSGCHRFAEPVVLRVALTGSRRVGGADLLANCAWMG